MMTFARSLADLRVRLVSALAPPDVIDPPLNRQERGAFLKPVVRAATPDGSRIACIRSARRPYSRRQRAPFETPIGAEDPIDQLVLDLDVCRFDLLDVRLSSASDTPPLGSRSAFGRLFGGLARRRDPGRRIGSFGPCLMMIGPACSSRRVLPLDRIEDSCNASFGVTCPRSDNLPPRRSLRDLGRTRLSLHLKARDPHAELAGDVGLNTTSISSDPPVLAHTNEASSARHTTGGASPEISQRERSIIARLKRYPLVRAESAAANARGRRQRERATSRRPLGRAHRAICRRHDTQPPRDPRPRRLHESHARCGWRIPRLRGPTERRSPPAPRPSYGDVASRHFAAANGYSRHDELKAEHGWPNMAGETVHGHVHRQTGPGRNLIGSASTRTREHDRALPSDWSVARWRATSASSALAARPRVAFIYHRSRARRCDTCASRVAGYVRDHADPRPVPARFSDPSNRRPRRRDRDVLHRIRTMSRKPQAPSDGSRAPGRSREEGRRRFPDRHASRDVVLADGDASPSTGWSTSRTRRASDASTRSRSTLALRQDLPRAVSSTDPTRPLAGSDPWMINGLSPDRPVIEPCRHPAPR